MVQKPIMSKCKDRNTENTSRYFLNCEVSLISFDFNVCLNFCLYTLTHECLEILVSPEIEAFLFDRA